MTFKKGDRVRLRDEIKGLTTGTWYNIEGSGTIVSTISGSSTIWDVDWDNCSIEDGHYFCYNESEIELDEEYLKNLAFDEIILEILNE